MENPPLIINLIIYPLYHWRGKWEVRKTYKNCHGFDEEKTSCFKGQDFSTFSLENWFGLL
jgi:hypothetical protein